MAGNAFDQFDTQTNAFDQFDEGSRFRLGGWRENLYGEGAVDTPGEVVGDIIGTGAAGVSRGFRAGLELPEMAGRGATWLGQAVLGVPKDERVAVMDTVTGDVVNRGYDFLAENDPLNPAAAGYVDTREGQTKAAKYAGTIGEFWGGSKVFPGAPGATKSAILAGAASETAGQLTEGEEYEDLARIVGAFTPSGLVALTKAPLISRVFKRGGTYPSVEALKAAKNEAYRMVDDAGVTFSPSQTSQLSANIDDMLAQSMTYVPDIDDQAKASATLIRRQSGQTLTLGQLDNIRQNLWRRYAKADDQIEILSAIGSIDDLIDSVDDGSDLMKAARLANSRFAKAQMLDDAFTKAARQAASTGSGGNIVNKYRQAVTSILSSPKKAKWFSQDEIQMMDAFVSPGGVDDLSRLIGKLSPSGNGLMAALNLTAAAYNPMNLFGTVAATGSKAVSEQRALQAADDLMNLVSTGVQPKLRASLRQDILRVIPGALAASRPTGTQE